MNITINDVKKDLYKSKVNAKFSHYIAGNLYYNIEVFGDVYEFPIYTIEEGPTFNNDESGLSMYEVETVILSSDLGTTRFDSVIKGSDLNRWIQKSIEKNEFIKIS